MIRVLTILFLATACHGAEWTLPTANQGWWTGGTTLGVDGGMLQYIAGGVADRAVSGTVRNVTQGPFNADNTGATDVTAGVQAAIDASSYGDVVYFPAGRYLFDGQVSIGWERSGVTIRGAGWSTVLSNSVAGNSFMYFTSYEGGTDTSQTVTGTKTKGTTALTVADSSGFAAHMLGRVDISNEEDNARITAGAAPTWSSSGFRNMRSMTCYITAVAAGQVTIDPPLPADCTDHVVTINRYQTTNYVKGVGLEDFTIAFDGVADPARGIAMARGVQCWAYNLHSTNWIRNQFNGQVINMAKCYKSEIRKNKFISHTNYSDDGSIQIYESTSCLIVDNILRGWDAGIYEFGKGYNNAVVANYISAAEGIIFHNGHSLLNLIYANAISSVRPGDGYHGSSSHQSVVGNWIMHEYEGMIWYGFAANRFNRNHAVGWNIVGEDGRVDGTYSLGYPNAGNLSSTGTAEPSTGDFWADWGMTGVLTTRTSASSGVVTVSGGDFAATTGGADRGISLYWSGLTVSRYQMILDSRVGLVLTVSGGGGSDLPAALTSFDGVWTYAQGYQERDLDVEPSLTFAENYEALAAGGGSVQDGTSDTQPVYVDASRPSWFYGLTYPPYNPNSPVFSEAQIPAGYRALNNDADPPSDSQPVITPQPGASKNKTRPRL